MARGWLFLLCAVLLIWYPLGFATELASTLPTIAMRGPVAIVELVLHGCAATLSVAAGWALAIRRPFAPAAASVALAGNALVGVQSQYWTVLPSQVAPGQELPLAALSVLHAFVWLVYVRRSRQVRAIASA